MPRLPGASSVWACVNRRRAAALPPPRLLLHACSLSATPQAPSPESSAVCCPTNTVSCRYSPKCHAPTRAAACNILCNRQALLFPLQLHALLYMRRHDVQGRAARCESRARFRTRGAV